MQYSTSYVAPCLKMREHPWFCYFNFITNLESQLRYLGMCPKRRVTENSHHFYTNHRSGKDRGLNPGHLHGMAAVQAAQTSTITINPTMPACKQCQKNFGS
jgi:hypothetical protein